MQRVPNSFTSRVVDSSVVQRVVFPSRGADDPEDRGDPARAVLPGEGLDMLIRMQRWVPKNPKVQKTARVPQMKLNDVYDAEKS